MKYFKVLYVHFFNYCFLNLSIFSFREIIAIFYYKMMQDQCGNMVNHRLIDGFANVTIDFASSSEDRNRRGGATESSW